MTHYSQSAAQRSAQTARAIKQAAKKAKNLQELSEIERMARRNAHTMLKHHYYSIWATIGNVERNLNKITAFKNAKGI